MIARLRNAAKTGTVTIRSHKYLDGKALGSFGKAYISLLNHHLRCYRSLQNREKPSPSGKPDPHLERVCHQPNFTSQ